MKINQIIQLDMIMSIFINRQTPCNIFSLFKAGIFVSTIPALKE